MHMVHALRSVTIALALMASQSANAGTTGICVNLNALYDAYTAASHEEFAFNEGQAYADAALEYETCVSYASTGWGQKSAYECEQDYLDKINNIPQELVELQQATQAALDAYNQGYQAVVEGATPC